MLSVRAVDEAGNEFHKELVLYTDAQGRRIVSFGWPVEYDEMTWNRIMWAAISSTSKSGNLCIDIGGRNHKGHPTLIQRDELLSVNRYIVNQWRKE